MRTTTLKNTVSKVFQIFVFESKKFDVENLRDALYNIIAELLKSLKETKNLKREIESLV